MTARHQRATTSKTYAMDMCYTKVLTDAKRIHRDDGKFYIDNINGVYTSISKWDYDRIPAYSERNLEEWAFRNGRWHKTIK